MIKSLVFVLAATTGVLGATSAHAGVSWSIGINAPGVTTVVSEGPGYYGRGYDRVYAPAPVYVPVYAPEPVYVPAPVYRVPPPVAYYPAPVYYRPEPVDYPVYYRGWHHDHDHYDHDRRWDHDRDHHEGYGRR